MGDFESGLIAFCMRENVSLLTATRGTSNLSVDDPMVIRRAHTVHTHRQTDRHMQTKRTQTHTDTYIRRHRHTHTQTDTHTHIDRQTDTHTHTHTHTHTYTRLFPQSLPACVGYCHAVVHASEDSRRLQKTPDDCRLFHNPVRPG